jgi:hypothetical protein
LVSRKLPLVSLPRVRGMGCMEGCHVAGQRSSQIVTEYKYNGPVGPPSAFRGRESYCIEPITRAPGGAALPAPTHRDAVGVALADGAAGGQRVDLGELVEEAPDGLCADKQGGGGDRCETTGRACKPCRCAWWQRGAQTAG